MSSGCLPPAQEDQTGWCRRRGAGNTWRQSQTPASTCLPPHGPTEPPPHHHLPLAEDPRGAATWTTRPAPSFRLLFSSVPLAPPSPPPQPRALQGAGHAAAPQEGFCPLRSPEMPGAPSGAKEKPSPVSLRPGRASGSSRPATSKPARHQTLGAPGTHTDAQASLGPQGALESACLTSSPSNQAMMAPLPSRWGNRGWGSQAEGPASPQAFPHPAVSSRAYGEPAHLFLHKHICLVTKALLLPGSPRAPWSARENGRGVPV